MGKSVGERAVVQEQARFGQKRFYYGFNTVILLESGWREQESFWQIMKGTAICALLGSHL
jgi:hypothetical protein